VDIFCGVLGGIDFFEGDYPLEKADKGFGLLIEDISDISKF
jgi:hypothetical protein